MSSDGVADVLRRHGIRPGRRLGQHFLLQPALLRRIAAAAEIAPGDPVLEVGPGVGVLTRELLRAGGRVTAVELDRALRPALTEVLGGAPPQAPPPPAGPGGLPADRLGPGLTLLWGDATRLPWGALAAGDPGPWRVCSNLPFYLTGPFLAALFEGGLPWSTAVLLVQAEVAARMRAEPGGRDYGAFTCLVGYHATVERLFSISRAAFTPPPDVDSVLVRLRRRPAPPVDVPRAALLRVVRAAFRQRRKTIRNALAGGLGAERAAVQAALAAAEIAADRRPETLSLAEYGRLVQALEPGAGDGAGRP